jgi:U2 small nuclear ribonucleoprotein B''
VQFSKQKSDIVAKKDGTFVPREKKRKFEAAAAASADASGGARPAKAAKLMINSVPHKILFAQALPEDCTDQMLTMLFQQYPGFVEVRMVPGKKGIAFIEFQDVVPASMALQQLNGFKLADGEVLHLTYGKQ